MTRKQRRLGVVLLGLAMLASAAALVLSAFEDSIVFFYSPTDLVTKDVPRDKRLRIGGLVKQGTLKRDQDGLTVRFDVTDLANTVRVVYRGILPDLFGEGQGVIAEGRFEGAAGFRADEVLAKHDETYMPPEVAEALKKAGMWKGGMKK